MSLKLGLILAGALLACFSRYGSDHFHRNPRTGHGSERRGGSGRKGNSAARGDGGAPPKPGFKTQEKTGIVVQLQQKARVNLDLSVGEASQTVAVMASGVELKTEDAAVGQVVENKRVVDCP